MRPIAFITGLFCIVAYLLGVTDPSTLIVGAGALGVPAMFGKSWDDYTVALQAVQTPFSQAVERYLNDPEADSIDFALEVESLDCQSADLLH